MRLKFFHTIIFNMKTAIKTQEEVGKLRQGGKLLAQILRALSLETKKAISEEITTGYLDNLARELIKEAGGKPAFLGFSDFPAALCVSINDQVVHGVPNNETVIKSGDLVKLDLGLIYKGLITDASVAVVVGENKKAQKMVRVAWDCLARGIKQLKPGRHLGDYGWAVENWAHKNGYSVVEKLVGHGVGYSVHEPPQIPNYGHRGTGMELKPGMVLALEPMLNEGSEDVYLAEDGFTYKTVDGKLSVQVEHTVVITNGGCEILTK